MSSLHSLDDFEYVERVLGEELLLRQQPPQQMRRRRPRHDDEDFGELDVGPRLLTLRESF